MSRAEEAARRREDEKLSEEYILCTTTISEIHSSVYVLVLAAFTADCDSEADSHLKEAESRINDEIKNLTKPLVDLDSEMLVEQIVRYQRDGNKWKYMLGIEKYHAPGYRRCQSQRQCPKRSLKGGKLETLPEQREDNWQDVNQACISFMLMNAQWTVEYIFGLFEKLVKTVNRADQVLDIEMEYPSVTVAKFLDALYDAKHNLLEDPSADINGNLMHMIKGPVKELMSATRKVEQVHVEHAQGQFEKPDALFLTDLTRLTLSAADPMIVGIAYVAVHDFPGLKVMFTNNKYLGSLDDVEKTGSPSVLVNMEIEVPGFP